MFAPSSSSPPLAFVTVESKNRTDFLDASDDVAVLPYAFLPRGSIVRFRFRRPPLERCRGRHHFRPSGRPRSCRWRSATRQRSSSCRYARPTHPHPSLRTVVHPLRRSGGRRRRRRRPSFDFEDSKANRKGHRCHPSSRPDFRAARSHPNSAPTATTHPPLCARSNRRHRLRR